MTDFLTRIAQRALGVAPVVQPAMASRYAPTPDLSVPAIFRPGDRASQNPAERTPDPASLSAHGSSSSNAGQIIRRAQSVDSVETDTGPFEASASPTHTYLDIQSPAENTETRGKPPEQSPALTIGEPGAAQTELQQPSAQFKDVKVIAHNANRADHSGAVVAREDDSLELSEAELRREETASAPELSLSRPEAAIPEGMIPEPTIPQPTIDAEPASHHGRDPLDSQAIAPRGGERLEANDSRERERSAPLTPPFSSEAIDRESSREKRLEQHARSDGVRRPLRSDASLINQSTAIGADQQLLSSKDVGDVHISSEKIIRVTIGRIDVRATAPPLPPVESPAPPAPKLSLDEFLQQDNRRRR